MAVQNLGRARNIYNMARVNGRASSHALVAFLLSAPPTGKKHVYNLQYTTPSVART